METIFFDATNGIDEEQLKRVTSFLISGEIVAIPTETVYGLAADARNEQAVQNIFSAKGRPSDNPLIVHVANKAQLYELTKDAPPYVDKLIDTFSPGPITYVLKKANDLAPSVTAGLSTVAIRIPDHPVAQAILQYSHLPLAAPSANLSGRPSPTLASHVAEDLSGKIRAIVDGGSTTVGLESTVLDCTQDVPHILRPGMITLEEIAKVAGSCTMTEQHELEDENPKSPGLKYTHYAPNMPLLLVKKEKIAEVIKQYQMKGKRIALLYYSDDIRSLEASDYIFLGENETAMAKNLYKALRKSEKKQVDLIICEMPNENVKKEAIFDRLSRAATEVIE